MATIASAGWESDRVFYRRMAVGISIFIVFAFGQFSARGFVDFGAAPIWVHVHALVFLSWLALFSTQNILAERNSLALHRKLGWTGAVLAFAMVTLGSFIGIKAVELGRQPPFFTPPYFLALTQIGVLAFGALILAAILRRRRTDWHQRLMLSATVMLLEPAFGRLLPMPLIGPQTGEMIAMALQVGVLAIAMAHDRKALGRIHPALLWGTATVVATHLLITWLATTPLFVDWARRIAPV